ncbi:hypothetical protein J6590_088244 [Homalodisca vitripennis]|nr:hypothetical protein J6590_088244 [Homalodisca vitripennis]
MGINIKYLKAFKYITSISNFFSNCKFVFETKFIANGAVYRVKLLSRDNEIKIVERGCCLMGDCSLSDPVIATDYEAFSPHFNCYRGLLSPNSAW